MSSESALSIGSNNLQSTLKTMNFPEYHQIVKSVIRADAMLAGQRKILKLLARQAPLFETLHLLVSTIEEQYDGLFCSIILIDEQKQILKASVESDKKNDFNYDVNGVSILPPYLGPCCKAANLGVFVTAEDIANDANWGSGWLGWARANNLRSCRSHPIFSSTGAVLGTFAMYLKESAEIEKANVYQIELATHIAGIAIERKQIEEREKEWREKMTEVNKNLENSVRLRDDFLNVTTHELNSPLATMKMWTTYKKENLIETGNCDMAEMLAMLESHEKLIDRVLGTVKTITDASNIDEGQQSLNLSELNLNEVLIGTIDRLKPVINESGCVVKLNAKGHLNGMWDQIRMEQVFTNLITNAIKYGGPGEIQVNSEYLNNQVVISFKDNGYGIAREYHQKIFERYQRVENNQNAVRGLGLGLYIVREIVTAHGGRVYVESEMGRGAKFVIELPIQKNN